MKYRYEIEQNSDEWYAIKVGKFSASTAHDLLMDKQNKGYQKLISKIVEERITWNGSESSTFKGNQFTDRGHELEPLARENYELSELTAVKQVGVVEMDNWVLCSPDGLIDENGLIQIKCPIFSTQIEYLEKYNSHKDTSSHNDILKSISKQYYNQMQFELFVTGREYNVFYSYHPYLKPVSLVIMRDDKTQAVIVERLEEAKKEVEQQINYIKSL